MLICTKSRIGLHSVVLRETNVGTLRVKTSLKQAESIRRRLMIDDVGGYVVHTIRDM